MKMGNIFDHPQFHERCSSGKTPSSQVEKTLFLRSEIIRIE